MAKRSCSVDGCERQATRRGWCGKHYWRWRVHGDPAHASKVWRYGPDATCEWEGCDRRPTARGMCSKHYNRARGVSSGPIGTPEERYEANIERNANHLGCWLWTGPLRNHGYASFSVDASDVYVHRWSYEHHVGPIPEGHQIDHLCRVKHCSNPDHLEAVTPRENLVRGTSPAAQALMMDHCKRGHRFTVANTYIRPDTGYRQCRACARIRDSRRRAVAS